MNEDIWGDKELGGVKTQPVADTDVVYAHNGVVTSEEHKSENVAGPVNLTGPTCLVGLELSRTINLGDFNSVRLQVSLVYPCPPADSEVEDTYNAVAAWVDAKLGALVDQVKPVTAVVEKSTLEVTEAAAHQELSGSTGGSFGDKVVGEKGPFDDELAKTLDDEIPF